MLTKKDFVLLAETVSKISNKALKLVAYTHALKTCKASNPRFDEKRFRKACGL